MTTSNNMVRSLIGLRCNNLHEHQTVEGKNPCSRKSHQSFHFHWELSQKVCPQISHVDGKSPNSPWTCVQKWSMECPCSRRASRSSSTQESPTWALHLSQDQPSPGCLKTPMGKTAEVCWKNHPDWQYELLEKDLRKVTPSLTQSRKNRNPRWWNPLSLFKSWFQRRTYTHWLPVGEPVELLPHLKH